MDQYGSFKKLSYRNILQSVRMKDEGEELGTCGAEHK